MNCLEWLNWNLPKNEQKDLVWPKTSFIFFTGLRHITILKLLGLGEDIGGVLELYPINGKQLFPSSQYYPWRALRIAECFFAVISLKGWVWLFFCLVLLLLRTKMTQKQTKSFLGIPVLNITASSGQKSPNITWKSSHIFTSHLNRVQSPLPALLSVTDVCAFYLLKSL